MTRRNSGCSVCTQLGDPRAELVWSLEASETSLEQDVQSHVNSSWFIRFGGIAYTYLQIN